MIMQTSQIKTLKDVLPIEFMGCEYDNSQARKYADVTVVAEHDSWKPGQKWIGTHKNVMFWVELENGYAVGFNESPARGWGFPVEKMKK